VERSEELEVKKNRPLRHIKKLLDKKAGFKKLSPKELNIEEDMHGQVKDFD
jgi:hypothetical protein